MFLVLFSLVFSLTAQAEVLVARLDGMTCVGCQSKVVEALEGLPFVGDAKASTLDAIACAELTGPLDKAAVHAVITALEYTVTRLDTAAKCPTKTRENWGDIDGLDVRIISHGEKVDIEANLAQKKFTVVDFGAVWCAPCHAAEALLKVYLRDHPDTAVRAIVLDGADPDTSFAHPAAQQHLSQAPGLPYFVVYNPKAKIIYRGVDVVKVLEKMDKKR